MLLKDIEKHIESQVPPNLAIKNDFIGFMDDYDLNNDIENVKIYMDFYPNDDNYDKNNLVLCHHKPLFTPKTPTYVLHSNWDVYNGGANEALAKTLNLKVLDVFDKELGIGRVCKAKDKNNFIKDIKTKFKDVNIVNECEDFDKIAIISGFGLKNPKYIELAKNKNIDILISGDLTHETAVLSINNNLCLIDLGHHNSEIPGLVMLQKLFKDTGLDCEVINNPPWKKL